MKKSGRIPMKRVITGHRRNPSYIIKEKDKSICKEKERECDVCGCINHRHILTKLEEKKSENKKYHKKVVKILVIAISNG
jgi:hypothetical protein